MISHEGLGRVEGGNKEKLNDMKEKREKEHTSL
jgi:hypothetical protein